MMFRLRHLLGEIVLPRRRKCPRCGAIGTWQAHGGWLDRADLRHVPRWMCKWCGLYRGIDGTKECVIDTVHNVWRPRDEAEGAQLTPQEVVRRSAIPNAWPWRH